jgi:hypothetical protein
MVDRGGFSQRLFVVYQPVLRIRSSKCSFLMRIPSAESEKWPRFFIFLCAAPRNAIKLDRIIPQYITE